MTNNSVYLFFSHTVLVIAAFQFHPFLPTLPIFVMLIYLFLSFHCFSDCVKPPFAWEPE